MISVNARPVRRFDGPSGSVANGNTGDQANSANWRWYNSSLLTAGGTLENNTGTRTFVFPIPCAPGGPNAWVEAKAMRFIIQGDTNAAAIAFGCRAVLVWRTI